MTKWTCGVRSDAVRNSLSELYYTKNTSIYPSNMEFLFKGDGVFTMGNLRLVNFRTSNLLAPCTGPESTVIKNEVTDIFMRKWWNFQIESPPYEEKEVPFWVYRPPCYKREE